MTPPFATLARSIAGTVLLPEDAGYAGARQVFNVGRQGVPAAIAQCASVDDVVAAVRFARGEGLSLAVRAGGHSIGGSSAPTGALVLDLRWMNQVAFVDGAIGVGGGCTWADVLAGLEPHRVATPGAYDVRVGVAGLTLGGGYGILTRAHGLACDNLDGAEVVTAGGEVVHTDDAPDLLWALRGAGAGFGVVTRLRFRARPIERLVAGAVFYPLEQMGAVLPAVRDILNQVPPATTINVGISTAGAGAVVLMGYHLGPLDVAKRWLAPLVTLGQPTSAGFRELGYREVHGAGHETFPEGHAHSWGADFVRTLDDDILAAVAEHALSVHGEDLWIVLEHLGGAVASVAAGATAFPHRDAGFGIVSTVKWIPAGPAPRRVLDAQAALHRALAPRSLGRYVNYVVPSRVEADLAAVYAGNLRRLRELKRRWDPDTLFRHGMSPTSPHA